MGFLPSENRTEFLNLTLGSKECEKRRFFSFSLFFLVFTLF